MHTGRIYLISLILSYKVRKKADLSVVPPTKSTHVVSSIFSPKIQLGPNRQQSTTKLAVTRLMCNAVILVEFHIIDTII